jgi:hypothetical protein
MMHFYKKPLAAILMLLGVSAYAQFPAPYCNISFTSTNGIEPITLVQFAGINNPSAATIGGNALEDFLSLSGDVTAGVTYPITVNGNTGGNYTNYFRVYIDWNQNNDFTDPGESYDLGSIVNNNGTGPVLTSSIAVPVTALGGTTRMRVMKRFNTYPTGPCQTGAGYGQGEDYTLNVTAAEDCTGAPAIGAVSSSETSVCAGVAFTLNADVTPAPGLSYQWEVSTDGGDTWNPLDAAQNVASYSVTSQDQASSYRLVVTCIAGGSTTSDVVSVAQNPVADCYCTPAFVYNCTDGDLLLNVSFMSVNNPSGCSTNGYIDYGDTLGVPVVDAGGSFPVSVTVGPSGDGWLDESAGVWIDYNQNGVFEANEFTYIGTGLDEVLTQNVTIPTDALDGVTRIRFVASATVASAFDATYACGPVSATQNYGEMEDYRINISNPLATPGHTASQFSLYPNPTNGSVNLQFATSIDVKSVSVISISGRTVYSQNMNGASDVYQLDLQDIASGVYIVKVDTAEGSFNKRLVKQ